MWFVLLSLRVSAATDISVGSDIGVTGNQVTIPVTLNSDVAIVGLQLDVNFDATRLTSAAVQKGAVLEVEHVVQSNELSPGQLRILLYSNQNTTIASGDILQLGFGVPEGAPLGPVTVSLSGVLLADPSATAVSADSSDSGVVTVTDTPPAVVQGRMLFYNNSSFDTSSDADAIATDKVALLPGGVATFANYSSYSRGINGIMIDVANLAQPGNIDASDFTFKVGNTDDPSSWSFAEAPLSISVEEGGGDGGTDRIILLWKDDNDDDVVDLNEAITGAWLEVSVVANSDTGLTTDSVFYFGNGQGEVGDRSGIDANVNIADVFAVFNNQAANVGVSNVYDHDRDRAVNIVDLFYTFNHQAAGTEALNVIDLSGVGQSGFEAQRASSLPLLGRDGFVRMISGSFELTPSDEGAWQSGRGQIEKIQWLPAADESVLTFRISGAGERGNIVFASSLDGEAWQPVPEEWIQRLDDWVVDVSVPGGGSQRALFFRYNEPELRAEKE